MPRRKYPPSCPVLEVYFRQPDGSETQTAAQWEKGQPCNDKALAEWAESYNRLVSHPDGRWISALGYAPVTHRCVLRLLGEVAAEWYDQSTLPEKRGKLLVLPGGRS